MTDPEDGDRPAVRTQLQLLRDPVVGPFFAGKFLSTGGMWIHNIAAAIVMFDLTRSAVMVGAVSIAQFGPQFLLTPWSGARADRGDRRGQLVMGRLLIAVGSGLIALWYLIVGPDAAGGPAVVLAASGLVGVGGAIGGPAMHALLPSMVRPGELPAAMALNAIPFTISRAGGPAIGALLLAIGGPVAAFGAASLTNLSFAVILLLLSLSDVDRGRPRDSSILAGLRFVLADPALVALLLAATVIGVGSDPAVTLTPIISDNFGGDSILVGALASSFGIGAAIAYPLLGWYRERFGLPRVSAAGLATIVVGTAGVALAPTPTTAIIAFAVAGAGLTFAVVGLATEIQERAPEELRGRIMSLWSICFLGSRPLAAAVNGSLADWVGPRTALWTTTAIVLLGTWNLARSRRPGSAPEPT